MDNLGTLTTVADVKALLGVSLDIEEVLKGLKKDSGGADVNPLEALQNWLNGDDQPKPLDKRVTVVEDLVQ